MELESPINTEEARNQYARDISAALRPAPAPTVPKPEPISYDLAKAPDTKAFGEAKKAYDAQQDAYIAGLMSKPAMLLTTEEQSDLRKAIISVLRG